MMRIRRKKVTPQSLAVCVFEDILKQPHFWFLRSAYHNHYTVPDKSILQLAHVTCCAFCRERLEKSCRKWFPSHFALHDHQAFVDRISLSVILVGTKDGIVHFCIDYRWLNAIARWQDDDATYHWCHRCPHRRPSLPLLWTSCSSFTLGHSISYIYRQAFYQTADS